MSLIKCFECSADVSDKALVCPHCGVVFRKVVVTIESTSKSLKLLLLISYIVIFSGLSMSALMYSNRETPVFIVGVSIAITGFALLIFTRFEIWWNHD